MVKKKFNLKCLIITKIQVNAAKIIPGKTITWSYCNEGQQYTLALKQTVLGDNMKISDYIVEGVV